MSQLDSGQIDFIIQGFTAPVIAIRPQIFFDTTPLQISSFEQEIRVMAQTASNHNASE
ncbi:MAG: hypothetical protein KDI74_06610 [Gammaproteobacteria bacterium]|nr:hypothetical protein [Gammaproteobacteria bacterium]